jgi:hypothetical protein
MRNLSSAGFYILLFVFVLQSCSKSVSKTNTGTGSTGTTTGRGDPDSSKYVVDTYAGKVIENSISGPTEYVWTAMVFCMCPKPITTPL